jgi:hypothetical protein
LGPALVPARQSGGTLDHGRYGAGERHLARGDTYRVHRHRLPPSILFRAPRRAQERMDSETRVAPPRLRRRPAERAVFCAAADVENGAREALAPFRSLENIGFILHLLPSLCVE